MAKKGAKDDAASRPADPEMEEKKRLRSLAFSKKLLRRAAPAKPFAPLEPSKSVLKLDGRDIAKRGQRKCRYLFSFPGLLAPVSGGRIGELADLGTRNPILYLEFPQGRMKLFGTHVYPKNRYLTLQLTKSSKGVMCEDTFDSLIVFSEAWWIGLKEENPEECQLQFPKDFSEGKHADHDFKGGAGATSDEASGAKKLVKECKEPLSPDTELDDEMEEDSLPLPGKSVKNVLEATPVRQSARTSGKTLNYAESTSGDDSMGGDDTTGSDAEVPEIMKEQMEGSSPTTSSPPLASETEVAETKKLEQLSSSKKSKDLLSKKGTMVQATLSTLFAKATEKKSKRSEDHFPESKGSGGKRQRIASRQKISQVHVAESDKKVASSVRKKTGTATVSARKKSQVSDDKSDEISSESQDGSDGDWCA